MTAVLSKIENQTARRQIADKNSVMDLLTNEIKDLYSAKKQLTKAIPKMVKGANDAALKDASPLI